MTEALIQGSPEWLSARCGKVTASRVADVIGKTKSGYAAARANYMAELIAERLTGQPADRFQNDAMRWGTEYEPEARDTYAFIHDVDVVEVGLVAHPAIEMCAASPDGLVGTDGLVEIKCPNTATHLDTVLTKAIPAKYETQMLWQMACTGRDWCDFVSYDPRLPDDLRMFVKRLERNDDRIAELEDEVSKFLAELDAKIARLRPDFTTGKGMGGANNPACVAA